MSDTIKAGDLPRKPQDQAARAVQLASEVAGNATKDAAASVAVMANAAEASVPNLKEAAKRATEAAIDTEKRVVSVVQQGSQGMRASSTQAMDAYTDVTARSAERLQAFMASAMTLTLGLQKMQHAWLEALDTSMERAAHRPEDLMRCKSLTDIAEVQCDFYKDAINLAFETSNRMLELAGHVTQEAMRPPQIPTH